MLPTPIRQRLWRAVEWGLWLAGVGLLLTYGAVRSWSFHELQEGLERFAVARTQESAATTDLPTTLPLLPEPDRSLWSTQRIRAYDSSTGAMTPIGVLRI